ISRPDWRSGGRVLLRLQSAEVDAAPFQLDGRTCDDGLLRADALQQPPWHRGHRRHEDVLRVADAGALENLRDALRFFLVLHGDRIDRKSTRLNSSHQIISYAVFCLKKKKIFELPLEGKTRRKGYLCEVSDYISA